MFGSKLKGYLKSVGAGEDVGRDEKVECLQPNQGSACWSSMADTDPSTLNRLTADDGCSMDPAHRGPQIDAACRFWHVEATDVCQKLDVHFKGSGIFYYNSRCYFFLTPSTGYRND